MRKTKTYPAIDNANSSQSIVWKRIALVFIVVASIGLLICAGLLIQAYVAHKPPFKLLSLELDYSFFKPGFELLGYSSIVLYIAGSLSLIMILSIFSFGSTQRKKVGYSLAFIAAILLLLAFWLSFTSRRPELQWWGYSSRVISTTGYFALSISTLINKEGKPFRGILGFLAIVLIFIASVLILFQYS